jgi:hypothetical protein
MQIFHINPLNAKLNPICHLLALIGAHHILHVSRIRVKILQEQQNIRNEDWAYHPIHCKKYLHFAKHLPTFGRDVLDPLTKEPTPILPSG